MGLFFNRPRAVLSGIEIAEAVARQAEYARLRRRDVLGPHGDYGSRELGWWERLKLAWLGRQPRIVFDDFDPTPSHRGGRCNPNSVNARLAPDLLVYDVPVMPDGVRHSLAMTASMQDGGRQDHDAVWDEYALDMKRDNPTTRLTLPPEGYVLKPGRLYLGRTVERVGAYNAAPQLHGRSSVGRLGVSVHSTAGYIDVGFVGTITLEITVVHPVRVYPDVAICQIDFAPVSHRCVPYQSNKYQGQVEPVASRLFMDFAAGKKERATSPENPEGSHDTQTRH